MTIDSGQGELQAGPDNSILLTYPNDMMDGFFVSNDDHYCFIHAGAEGFTELKEAALSEGIPIGIVKETADLDQYPHNLVIEALGRFVLDAAEESKDMPVPEKKALTSPESRELRIRDEHGIYVRLGWLPASNTLEIVYVDERGSDSFHAVVPNDKGNDAFIHPNIYRPEKE